MSVSFAAAPDTPFGVLCGLLQKGGAKSNHFKPRFFAVWPQDGQVAPALYYFASRHHARGADGRLRKAAAKGKMFLGGARASLVEGDDAGSKLTFVIETGAVSKRRTLLLRARTAGGASEWVSSINALSCASLSAAAEDAMCEHVMAVLRLGESEQLAAVQARIAPMDDYSCSLTEMMEENVVFLSASQKRIPALASSSLVTMDDFDVIAHLGTGAFAKVLLVRRLATNTLHAMKIIKKARVAADIQIQHTLAEKDALAAVDHPFLVHLHMAFQSRTKLYLVLEYAMGGELYFHQQQQGRFSRARVQLYAAEIALALEHLHSLGYIYRDLKPENLLLSRSGHIKLTDFGLVKDIASSNGSTSSFCGTPEYMAPETVRGLAYGYGVDWWSLGIVIFELFSGNTPFLGATEPEIYDAILANRIKFPKCIPRVARSLISGLLDTDPETRFGSDEFRSHDFFANLDFDRVLARGYVPEFVPELATLDDVSNFDPFFTSDLVLSPRSDVDASDVAHFGGAFKDFAYHAEASHDSSAAASNPLPLIRRTDSTPPVSPHRGHRDGVVVSALTPSSSCGSALDTIFDA